ncbi:DUF805 domain-containing protein [Aminobacter sp. P9b]|uniref:DUF805 domain-containing protein n=1 Tax=Aminobacter sp. P9b TaxID=3133697 RepID=UPI00324E405E
MDWKYLLTSFDGRINRAKFWACVAVFVVTWVVFTILIRAFGLNLADPNPDMAVFFARAAASFVFGLLMMYMALAVYAKRWHDRGKTGWWSLIAIVPVIGTVWIVVELGILEGDRGANEYGPDPLA